MNEFLLGISYFFSGFSFILRPRIRKFVFIPLAINIVLFSVAIFFAFDKTHDFLTSLSGWWDWLEWLLWPLFVIALLIIVFFSFSILANLIAAPFNGLLAETVEYHLEGGEFLTPNRSITMEVATSIVSELSKILYFASRAIPLLIISLIPGMQILWLLFGVWMLSLEYLDFPMSNHGMTFKQERKLIKERKMLALGFGSATMVMALIPVLNFIVMPVAVCAATNIWFNEYRKLTNQG